MHRSSTDSIETNTNCKRCTNKAFPVRPLPEQYHKCRIYVSPSTLVTSLSSISNYAYESVYHKECVHDSVCLYVQVVKENQFFPIDSLLPSPLACISIVVCMGIQSMFVMSGVSVSVCAYKISESLK